MKHLTKLLCKICEFLYFTCLRSMRLLMVSLDWIEISFLLPQRLPPYIVSPSRLFIRPLSHYPSFPNPPTISLRFPTVRVDSSTGFFSACPFSFYPLEFSQLMFLTSRSRSLPPPLQSTRERLPSFHSIVFSALYSFSILLCSILILPSYSTRLFVSLFILLLFFCSLSSFFLFHPVSLSLS